MSDYQQPSKDPSSDASMASMLRAVFKKLLQGVDGQLPAVVISYDRATNLAVVQPTIEVLTTGGETVGRPSYGAIPVLAIGGGGFNITFPLKPGDTGWIEASDRDISLWQQSGGKSARPNSERLHTFSDARFIPDVLAKYVVPDDAGDDMVIQSRDGGVYIALGPGRIKMKAPSVVVDSPDIVLDGIKWQTHKHGGVESGGSQTSGPAA